jgi:hypothetical protein
LIPFTFACIGIEWKWTSHKPDAAGGTAIPLGLTRVDAMVDIKVSDSGCNSGIGLDVRCGAGWTPEDPSDPRATEICNAPLFHIPGPSPYISSRLRRDGVS